MSVLADSAADRSLQPKKLLTDFGLTACPIICERPLCLEGESGCIQPCVPEGLVGFEVAAFRPFIPGIDEDEFLIVRPVPAEEAGYLPEPIVIRLWR